MKTFSSTAHVHHQNFIKKKLTSDKSPNTQPIPVTVEEEEKQSAISSTSNNDLICVIQTLIESLINHNSKDSNQKEKMNYYKFSNEFKIFIMEMMK